MKRLFTTLILLVALVVEAQIVNTNGLQVTAATNTASYFIGNGGGLTNVPSGGTAVYATNIFRVQMTNASLAFYLTNNGASDLLNTTNLVFAFTPSVSGVYSLEASLNVTNFNAAFSGGLIMPILEWTDEAGTTNWVAPFNPTSAYYTGTPTASRTDLNLTWYTTVPAYETNYFLVPEYSFYAAAGKPVTFTIYTETFFNNTAYSFGFDAWANIYGTKSIVTRSQ